MKLNICLLLCVKGLVTVTVSILRTVPHKYEVIMTPATWSDAQNYCRRKYNDLATILSDTDWLRLNKEIANNGLLASSSLWVGLYNDVNSWRWSLNDLPLSSASFTNWNSAQAGDIGGEAACGIIAGNNQWCAVSCVLIRPFICYDATFIGANKFIGISSSWMTWPEAQAYCRTYHTDLASSLTSSDDAILVQIKTSQSDSWIGLYRDTWKWSDGTDMTNLPWAPGDHDVAYNKMNCVVVSNKQFHDQLCSNLNYFVCHTISPMRGQIMRLQVESDGRVLDPALQSSILEQIKLNLKGNGMLGNTTVTWRVQPDGNIFKKIKSIISK